MLPLEVRGRQLANHTAAGGPHSESIGLAIVTSTGRGKRYIVRSMLLVPLDGSEASEASLPWAVKLAQDRSLTIMLARVVEYPHLATETWGPGVVKIQADMDQS